jgi:ribonuclease Z
MKLSDRGYWRHCSVAVLLLLPIGAFAAGGVVKDPTGVAPDRYVYYPGTEALEKDEIRVTACGTGMPAARHGQAATCFLMEFGNGEKLIFDIGSGSMENIAAYMIPYEFLDKIFLSHLHTDHMGDLGSIWAGGWTAGRPAGLKVWGPSGLHPELGTAAMIDGFLKYVAWDKETRSFAITPAPGEVEVTEFDYKVKNQVVYESDGIVVRSFPAIHTGDGPVSYAIEYAGLKVVFGGDTAPNRWFLDYAADSDLVIHESFMVPSDMVKWYNQPPQLAWRACCAFHTSGQAFGKIMSTIKPEHAVAYHFLNEEATRYNLYDAIRETYDGPLSMAEDKQHGLEYHERWRGRTHGSDYRGCLVRTRPDSAGPAGERCQAGIQRLYKFRLLGRRLRGPERCHGQAHGAVQPAGSGLAPGDDGDDP